MISQMSKFYHCVLNITESIYWTVTKIQDSVLRECMI